MAQKTNPNILRLGKSKEWKYKYFEKKSEEFSTYNFKNLELKTYIKNFLKKNGLLLQDLKINFYKSNITIYVPYYNTSKSSLLINQKKLNQNIKIKKKFKINKNQK
jgi:hypothetical protein